jgi:hypothetical protein
MLFKPSFGSFRGYCFGTPDCCGARCPAEVFAGGFAFEPLADDAEPGAGRRNNPLSGVPVTAVAGNTHSLANDAGSPSCWAMLAIGFLTQLQRSNISNNRPTVDGGNLGRVIGHRPVAIRDDVEEVA